MSDNKFVIDFLSNFKFTEKSEKEILEKFNQIKRLEKRLDALGESANRAQKRVFSVPIDKIKNGLKEVYGIDVKGKMLETSNKMLKQMQSQYKEYQKELTAIAKTEEEKRLAQHKALIKKGYVEVDAEAHKSSKLDATKGLVSKYGELTTASGKKIAKRTERLMYDDDGNIVKNITEYSVINDKVYAKTHMMLVDKTKIAKFELDALERSKRITEQYKEQFSYLSKNVNLLNEKTITGAKAKSIIGTGKVTGGGELSSASLPKGYKQFYQDIDDGRGKIERWTATVDKANKVVDLNRSKIKDANRDHKTFIEQMKIATSRIFQWGVATNIVYGSLNQIRQGIGFIVELDKKMNEIRMVTGATADETKELAKSYNALAGEMGSTTMDIANMANEFYRQGLNAKETNERMKETIKYSKISGMTTEETAEIITASANSYEFAGKEIGKMVDILSYLGDESASGSDEVGRGMQKVAASAKLAGVEYEWLGAKVATISETTRESAETIGVCLLIQ